MRLAGLGYVIYIYKLMVVRSLYRDNTIPVARCRKIVIFNFRSSGDMFPMMNARSSLLKVSYVVHNH